jgi:epoxyqueuosine reductase
VVTTLGLVPDAPIAGRCGECTACLDACPTAAFPEPFVLDARRCVAYLTIEAREVAPEPLRAGIGERVFGCDTCQDVCPFNAGRGSASDPRPFLPHARLAESSLEALAALDAQAFDALREGSPLGRPGRDGLRRNAAIALGNRGPHGDATREVLEALADDPSPTVREAASWALGRAR